MVTLLSDGALVYSISSHNFNQRPEPIHETNLRVSLVISLNHRRRYYLLIIIIMVVVVVNHGAIRLSAATEDDDGDDGTSANNRNPRETISK